MTHTIDYSDLFNMYLQFNTKQIKILIAEDVEENRDFLKAVFRSPLISVRIVLNMETNALKVMKEKKFRILF